MATEKQIVANRANALKSTGPKTRTTREKSSLNGLSHGMLARTIVLQGESMTRFHLLVAGLHDQFQPQSTVECTLVENMAVARWRQMRLWAMERAGLAHEILKREANFEPDFAADEPSKHDSATRAALAFRSLSDRSKAMDLMNRYEARYDRQYSRALDLLLQFRQKGIFPNEPNS